MTVYDLIRELAAYEPTATMRFKVGSLETDDVNLTCKNYSCGDEVTMELN